MDPHPSERSLRPARPTRRVLPAVSLRHRCCDCSVFARALASEVLAGLGRFSATSQITERVSITVSLGMQHSEVDWETRRACSIRRPSLAMSIF